MLRKRLNIAGRGADAAEDFADDPTASGCLTVSLYTNARSFPLRALPGPEVSPAFFFS